MCFSWSFFQNVLIAGIIIVALVLFLRVVASGVLGTLGVAIPGWVLEALKIVIWAVVAIAFVIIVFDVLKCVLHLA